MSDNTGRLKVRFAPSPTGYLHVGGARTALFNFLYARNQGGTFLLRIEDTDVNREAENSYDQILSDLNWLGIQWDEGPVRQTGRLEIYREYVRRLLDEGKAYQCFCTPKELEEKRQDESARGTATGYDGTCRNLTPEQITEKQNGGLKPCIRFRVPDKSVTVHDIVRGDVEYQEGFAGDFVILKSDGTPSYNFAVVIDDHLMEVTHVIRGEEHLVNTPRQILLYEALQFPLPVFAHTSMILAPDRSKMSKRHGTVAVGEYRNQGVLPQALVNYIALLGWSPVDQEEFYTMDQLKSLFSLDRVSKSPAVYDEKKLHWMNGRYISNMDSSELLDLVMPYFKAAPYYSESLFQDQNRLLAVISATKERVSLLPDFVREAAVFFDDSFPMEEDAMESLKSETAIKVIDAFIQVLNEMGPFDENNFMDRIKEIQKISGAKGKHLYMPLRASITGQAHGIEMKDVLTILTKDQMLKRLSRTRQMLCPVS